MDDLLNLSDDHLLMMIDRSARGERERMPDFLACLGELDRRKLAERKGYSSTFDYCVRWLKLSEDEAYRRIHAARAAVSRPQLLVALADGQLSMTSVSKIAPHVGRADAPQLIARAEGKSTREVIEMLAPLNPVPEKRDSIRSIVVSAAGEKGGVQPAVKRVEFSFQASPALGEAIERAKQLLSHKYPFSSLEDVLTEVVGFYLERHDPQRALKLGRLAPVRGSSSIPAGARRAVWARDGGRCVFSGVDGVRCLSRRMLEIDHKKPRALGGSDELANLRLLCRPHNDAERRRLLGEGKLSTDLARAKFGDNLRS